jgi:glycosyltransferase involved in cell wall biosynthesis
MLRVEFKNQRVLRSVGTLRMEVVPMMQVLRRVVGFVAGLFIGAFVNSGLLSVVHRLIPLPDGVDGLLVPPGDVAGTTHALERLLNHPNSRSPIIEAASRTVREKFSMERVFTDWHALLSEASGRG